MTTPPWDEDGEAPRGVVRTGEVLDGRWRLEERIGHGVSGSVFRGEDLREGGPVAIKILSAGNSRRRESVARFEREARVLTTLHHPNLVRLLGVGHRGRVPYLAMELLEGFTLAAGKHRWAWPLPPLQALRIAQQLLGALDFLHRNDLVHRDIKPQNVFLSPAGRATLLDLGVVRDLSAPGLTAPGAMVGTPFYMAPEQTRLGARIDRRTDLYAMGALVFELLTGAPPFTGKSSFEVLHAHRNAPPPDASRQNRHVPPAVGALLQRALAKEADERPPTAGIFLDELERAFNLDQDRTHKELRAPQTDEVPTVLFPQPDEA